YAPQQDSGIILGLSDDDVGVSVSIHVARGRHAMAEVPPGLVAIGGPGGRRCEPRARAVVDKSPPDIRTKPGVVPGGADDDIRESVAVHVAGGRDRESEEGAGLVALCRPRRSQTQAACRTV